MASRRLPYRLVSQMDMGFGHWAQRIVYSKEDLLISLSNSLRLREQEIAERRSIKGRVMALFLGEDAGDTIGIDGMRLKQLLELAQGGAPAELVLAGFYEVDLAVFRDRLAEVPPPDLRDQTHSHPPTVVRR